jgi:hypothetical protein
LLKDKGDRTQQIKKAFGLDEASQKKNGLGRRTASRAIPILTCFVNGRGNAIVHNANAVPFDKVRELPTEAIAQNNGPSGLTETKAHQPLKHETALRVEDVEITSVEMKYHRDSSQPTRHKEKAVAHET